MTTLTGNAPNLLTGLLTRTDLACRGRNPDFWCPPDETRGPDGETLPIRPTEKAELLAIGKTICAGCPAKDECRTYARTAFEEGGVWGGEDEDERGEALYLEWLRTEGMEYAA